MRSTSLAALVLATAIAVAPVADARTVTGNTGNVAVETLDATRSVNLIIHKSTGNPFDEPAPGSLPDGGPAGFTFTLQRVGGVDLTTAEGWEKARSIGINDARAATTGPTYSATTDASGAARFEGLPIGLYYVVETPPETPGYSWASGAPFLLTLPIGDVSGEQWEYNVQLIAKADPPTPSTPPTPPTSETTVPAPPPTPKPTPSSHVTPTPTPGSTPDKDDPGTRIRERASELASTGAGVIGLVLMGLALVVGGLFLARRRRGDERDF
ncbi:SpaH/EbpB family LPXTG-anchored major pilin [Corynebacterium sp.]|uniref:SpaH/EbpB family LPXTG-anchored major pilin n=1 Tax=Corynebacterium sp. TaxID=1720 RepID=UPI002A9114B8|nr:SpaH/EbpB family LPXTG-anchored major pilin [Corynebacterium sp.]MDY5785154.1 SpaH/EbpB family LPXTG-anchored major pilin [Corynebacterium sp.]